MRIDILYWMYGVIAFPTGVYLMVFSKNPNLGIWIIIPIGVIIILKEVSNIKIDDRKIFSSLPKKISAVLEWIVKPHPFILNAFIPSTFLSLGIIYPVHIFLLKSICSKFICLPIFALIFLLCVIMLASMGFVFAFIGSEFNDGQNGRDKYEESTAKYTLPNAPIYAFVGIGLTLLYSVLFGLVHIIPFFTKFLFRRCKKPKAKAFR